MTQKNVDTGHEPFMRECLRLAERGQGSVSPNPLVGAVLVVDGTIVSRGYHRTFGGPHAEVACIRRFNGSLRSATLYVNLEPCCFHGKTPPCTDLIIASQIPSVVIAGIDPNPLVAGKGIATLRAAGVSVTTGVLREEAEDLNRIFFRHITRGRPYVHVKIAQSLNGMIAQRRRRELVISSAASRTLVHEWRSRYDAVLIGAGTVLSDDPSLTVRLTKGRDPAVVVIDGRFSISPASGLFRNRRKRQVYIFSDRNAVARQEAKARRLTRIGATILRLRGKGYRLPLESILSDLYARNIGSILVEGGSSMFTQFLASGIVDELSMFIAPTILRGGVAAFTTVSANVRTGSTLRIKKSNSFRCGRDVLLNLIFE